MPFRIVDHDSNQILLESPHVSDLIEYIDKNSEEYIKCMAKKTKKLGKKGLKKLNTDSKLTDWIKKKLNK